ncbi:GGDEF domain family protein (fragment) [Desulfamplus magnetovallimortis]|uniref:GGDEF domain family protein n=1 Tax=Desulfamplus magnetovallimortis TaxID=1246637 RepID=A0A1W1HCJ3_9BACT
MTEDVKVVSTAGDNASYPLSDEEFHPLAMIVDDDFSLRLAMGAALRKAGFEVVEAANGNSAVSLFQSRNPDLILMDVMMPGMNGFETCRAIRELPEGKTVQILMVTGLEETNAIEKAFEAGADDFVIKPIKWVMLGHRARYMLRKGQIMKNLVKRLDSLAKIQAVAKQGGWQINSSGSSFAVSMEAVTILGIEENISNITYEMFLSCVDPENSLDLRRTIDDALKNRDSFSMTCRICMPDNSVKHILLQGAMLSDQSDIMTGVVQDISSIF